MRLEPSREEGLADLFAALKLLPENRTSAFWRAQKECPDLVDRESDGMLFLRNDNFNYWKAAERLAIYWEERRNVFGHRWTLPIIQTGKGALTPTDVLSLHSGVFAILPKSNTGQSVMFVDRARALANATVESKVRAAFYVLSILSRQEHAQSKGILVFSLLVNRRLVGLDHSYVNRILKIIQIFPLKIRLSILNCPPRGRQVVAHQIFTAGLAFAGAYFGTFDLITDESSTNGVLSRLNEVGLQPSGIPTTVGGNWKYGNFHRWCREQIAREQVVAPAPTKKSALSAGATVQQESRGNTVDRKRERVRNLNAIHSRQKRERRKAEEVQLQEEYEKLVAVHRKLLDEKRVLEHWWMKAQEAVRASHDDEHQF